MPHSNKLYCISMPYSQIHLNNFTSFDHFLFGVEEKDWRIFLDEGYFIPPIANPVNIAQHQLCHYTYWMTIAKNNLKDKPRIVHGAYVPSLCYACKYADLLAKSADICSFCPLETDSRRFKCGKEFSNYINCTRDKSFTSNEASEWAEKIAKIIWKTPNSLSTSQILQLL